METIARLRAVLLDVVTAYHDVTHRPHMLSGCEGGPCSVALSVLRDTDDAAANWYEKVRMAAIEDFKKTKEGR